MSNSRIRRLFFNELTDKFSDADGQLKVPVLQNGITLTDSNGKKVDTNFTHIVVSLIPAPADTETLQGDHIRYMGIYQISVNILLSMDEYDANIPLEQIEDDLQRIFKINMLLSDAEGFTVQVISPIKVTEASRLKDTNWWQAHCYFNYRADTAI